jgi:hypothetical protein
MLHFSVVHLVNMNAPVCTFTNALHKNISDKGGVPCTLTTLVHYMYFDAHPTSYILFFGASLNEMCGACLCLPKHHEKGNKVRGAPCKFTGCTVGRCEPSASNALCNFFFFLHLKFHSILNFNLVKT